MDLFQVKALLIQSPTSQARNLRNSVVKGTLRHDRFVPERHSFQYKHCMLLLDVDILDQQHMLPYFLSYNHWGIFSIKDEKYIDSSNEHIKGKICRLFPTSEGSDKYHYLLLTTPRILGYSFNPASFYLKVNDSTGLEAAAVEVSNTYGESHIYVLDAKEHCQNGAIVFKHQKQFHVSPFIDRSGEYKFQLAFGDSLIDIRIDLFQRDERVISARFNAQYAGFGKWCLARSFLTIAATVLLTELRILIQAATLFLLRKKVRFFKKPRPLKDTGANLSPGFISKLKIPFK